MPLKCIENHTISSSFNICVFYFVLFITSHQFCVECSLPGCGQAHAGLACAMLRLRLSFLSFLLQREALPPLSMPMSGNVNEKKKNL